MGVILAGNDIYILIALIVHIKLGIAILSVIFRLTGIYIDAAKRIACCRGKIPSSGG
jgi:hypothetical protein